MEVDQELHLRNSGIYSIQTVQETASFRSIKKLPQSTRPLPLSELLRSSLAPSESHHFLRPATAVPITVVSATARSRRPHCNLCRIVPPSRIRCSASPALFHRAPALLCSSSATLHLLCSSTAHTTLLCSSSAALHPPLLQYRGTPPSSAPVPRRSRPSLLQFCRVQPSLVLPHLCALEDTSFQVKTLDTCEALKHVVISC
ncbi:hypothetical protein AHAS_Ahas03G0102600 [Arachis hypogaea]